MTALIALVNRVFGVPRKSMPKPGPKEMKEMGAIDFAPPNA
jgi:hypothetical protein